MPADLLTIAAAARVLKNRETHAETLTTQCLDQIAQKSPTALRLGRRAFYDTQDLPYEAQLEALCAQLSANADTDDAREGIAAFLQKRKPDFKGT